MWLVANGSLSHANVTLSGGREYGFYDAGGHFELVPHGLHYTLKAGGSEKLVHLTGGPHDGSNLEVVGTEQETGVDDSFLFDVVEAAGGGYLLKSKDRELYLGAEQGADGESLQLHGDKNFADSHITSHFDIIQLDHDDNSMAKCGGPILPPGGFIYPPLKPQCKSWCGDSVDVCKKYQKLCGKCSQCTTETTTPPTGILFETTRPPMTTTAPDRLRPTPRPTPLRSTTAPESTRPPPPETTRPPA